MNRSQSFLDLPISSLGYGCYGLSGAYGAKLTESEMIKVLQKAYELGIKYFDTSSSYASTEEVLGKATESFRHEITIASKVGLTKDNMTNLSRKFVKSSCESSLKKLKTDYIDIYQIHFHDPNTPIQETLEALEELKREGKIRYCGIGHLPVEKTIEYLGYGNISFVLAEMSPVNTFRYKELNCLKNNYDFNIIAFSITGRGLLSGTISSDTKFLDTDIRNMDPLFKRARMTSALRIAEKLKEIGIRHGKTPAQVAISWTIENPSVIVGLTGPTKIEHLEENSVALNWSLDKAEIEEINQFVEKEEYTLKKELYEEINNILTSSNDFEQSYTDLIYVLEHCIENRFMKYEDGVDIYMKIMKIKNSNTKTLDAINEIKLRVKSLVNCKCY